MTLYPPIENSLVALSGHMNVVSGTSQDGRQTLKEFVDAHRRIITDLYEKKSVAAKWRKDQETRLAGFPAKQVTFTYSDNKQGNVVEHHIMSLGRNEGRGIRVKAPLPDDERSCRRSRKCWRPTSLGEIRMRSARSSRNPIIPTDCAALMI